MVITDEMSRDYCKFMNFIMAPVYNVFFQERLPRVLPKMKEILHFSPERRREDWLIYEHGKVIRVYGFVHQPYILPTFFTVRVFALELIRQRLIVEDEHFLSYKKPSEIKFPWTVDPFGIKRKSSFLVIESMLRELEFSMEATINYDPHHIISNRRQVNKNKPFEHLGGRTV